MFLFWSGYCFSGSDSCISLLNRSRSSRADSRRECFDDFRLLIWKANHCRVVATLNFFPFDPSRPGVNYGSAGPSQNNQRFADGRKSIWRGAMNSTTRAARLFAAYPTTRPKEQAIGQRKRRLAKNAKPALINSACSVSHCGALRTLTQAAKYICSRALVPLAAKTTLAS